MRKIAMVPAPKLGGTVRAMIYELEGGGTYIFLYNEPQDGPCTFDSWCEGRGGAEEYCAEQLGIGPDDWQLIDDPLPGCQHDWIAPVRVKHDTQGKPLWGQFEPADD